MMRRLLAAFAVFLAPVLLPAGSANAQAVVNLGDGTFRPYPIAIPQFNAASPEAAELAQQITEVVRNDLRLTGLFDLSNVQAFIQRDLDINVEPRFADWRVIGADGLVVGEVDIMDDGRVLVSARLWNINGGELYRLNGQPGYQGATAPTNWRAAAHQIADRIYTRLTGEDGYLNTRIVFIAESGPKTNRVKKLAIMDQDGANYRELTSGVHTIITPRFSTSDQEITYMSYEGGRARVYLFNIETERQEVLGDFSGMTFAPRFSPDGSSVLFSRAENGNSDLYVMDLRTRQSRRLTDHPAIDVSPSMSPDGRAVVFNSDRGGSPQLYIMNTDGSPRTCPSGGRDTACRITFDQGRYSTPVWSPRGDLIAFTKQLRGRFYIGVIGVDGRGERLLTESYLDEGPTWSPNGRVISFFRENQPGVGPKIWSIDLTGRNLRQLPTPTDASDPAWSPLLDGRG